MQFFAHKEKSAKDRIIISKYMNGYFVVEFNTYSEAIQNTINACINLWHEYVP